jgi:WD40 repeat protein
MQKLRCPRGGSVKRLTFSPDGDLLAGIGSTALYCWTRSRDWELTGLDDKGTITGLAFHPTGRTLAYAGIAPAWSAPAPPPPPPGAPVPSAWRRRFARETPRPFTGVHLYPLTGVEEFVPNRVRVPHPEGAVVAPLSWARGLAFTPDGRVLLAAHVESPGFVQSRVNVYHWHFTENDGVWQVANPLAAVGPSENGGALMCGYLALAGEWGVAVCPVAPATGLYVPDVRTATAVAVAPGSELVATYARGPVTVWHLRDAKPVAVITPWWSVSALALAPNGLTLAIGHTENAVSFWDAPTGAPGPQRNFGVGPVTGLAYAPDGLTLAIAGRDGVVVVDTE